MTLLSIAGAPHEIHDETLRALAEYLQTRAENLRADMVAHPVESPEMIAHLVGTADGYETIAQGLRAGALL